MPRIESVDEGASCAWDMKILTLIMKGVYLENGKPFAGRAQAFFSPFGNGHV
jgi:hypothetical protein